ncbi:MAG: cephalosporin hydroxylase family protein [Thermoanaerobaculia bacterium]
MLRDPSDPYDPARAAAMAEDPRVRELRRELFDRTAAYRYSYNFRWLGRPAIQYPEDLMAMQEIIWETRPDLIIETGVAHGGSLVFYASMLSLLGGEGRVVGVDIEIRPHNRTAIEAHPLAGRITLIEGPSTADSVMHELRTLASGRRVIVALDSNHTHEHVLRELELYSPLVSKDSYLVVFDTVVEQMPENGFPDRPWGRGNNPMTAVHAFLRHNSRFVIDREIENKLLLTVCPDGFLRCVSG